MITYSSSLYPSLCSLIRNSYWQQRENVHVYDSRGVPVEYQIIGINGGRRAGHSTSIVMASLGFFAQPLIILPNMDMVKQMCRSFCGYLEDRKIQFRRLENNIIELPTIYDIGSFDSVLVRSFTFDTLGPSAINCFSRVKIKHDALFVDNCQYVEDLHRMLKEQIYQEYRRAIMAFRSDLPNSHINFGIFLQ